MTRTLDQYRIKLCFRPDGSRDRYAAVLEAARTLRPELRPVELERLSDPESPTEPWSDARWPDVAALCADAEPRSWTLYTAGDDAILVRRKPQQVVVELALQRTDRDPADELAELIDACGERHAPALAMVFETSNKANKADEEFVFQGLDNLADVPPVCFFDWALVAALDDAAALRSLATTRSIKGGLLAVVRPVFGKASKADRERSKLVSSGLGLPRSFVGPLMEVASAEELLVQYWPMGSQGAFNDVCISPDAAWLVGVDGQIAWWDEDEDEWLLVESNTEATLRAISASSEEHAVAVGDAGELVEWNGEVWSRRSPLVASSLLGVHATTDERALAVGASGTILRLDDGGWRAEPSGTTADLAGVTGSWIVGVRGTVLVRRQDAWHALESGVMNDLHAVSSIGDDAWAVGDAGLILRLDRERASRVDSGVSVTLRGVSAFAHDNVWAVGDDCTILHWDGRVWSRIETDTRERLHAVAAIDERHAWVVGDRSLILRAALR